MAARIELTSPQGVDDLVAVIDVDVGRAIATDPDPRIVHVTRAGRTRMYQPETHDEWVAVFNAALAALGDPRRFVSEASEDSEEAVYVLATGEDGDLPLPAPLSARERVGSLVDALAIKGVTARADDDALRLDLTLATAGRLLSRLRAAAHDDAKLDSFVDQEFVRPARE